MRGPAPDRHREIPKGLFNDHELAAIEKAVPLYQASNALYGNGGCYRGKTADKALAEAGITLGYRRGPVTYAHVCSAVIRRVRAKRKAHKSWTDDDVETVRTMYTAGERYHAIGRVLQRNVGSIAHQVAKMGLPKRRKKSA